MLRKALLLAIFGCFCMMLGAVVGISTVRMEDHEGTICRVVVSFTDEAKFDVNESAGVLELRVQDFDQGSKARIYTAKSELVTGIEQRDELLRLNIASPFRYETMSFDYPHRVAMDIFVASPNRTQRLAIGDFYAETGKLNSADRIYNALHHDYRNDAQVLYHWALLLAKRGSARLSDVVAMIPDNSPYYPRAQKLMAKLHEDEEPLAPPPPEAMPAPELGKAIDSVVVAAIPAANENQKADVAPAPVPSQATNRPWDYRAMLLIILAILLFIILYIMLYAKKHPHHNPLDETSEVPLGPDIDNSTVRKMVSKLLDDGWTHKEIARELKISPAQVSHIIHNLHHRKDLDEDS